MQETLLQIFEPLKSLNPIIYVVVIAFVPLIELRASIPVALWCLQLPWVESLLWSLAGSMMPAFLVIPFFAWGLNFLEKRGWLPGLTRFLQKKFGAKAAKVAAQNEEIEVSKKSGWQKEWLKFWAIAVFVGIPLPGTGVWTGSAVASLLKLKWSKAFGAVLVGDIIAGVIVTMIALLFNQVVRC